MCTYVNRFSFFFVIFFVDTEQTERNVYNINSVIVRSCTSFEIVVGRGRRFRRRMCRIVENNPDKYKIIKIGFEKKKLTSAVEMFSFGNHDVGVYPLTPVSGDPFFFLFFFR